MDAEEVVVSVDSDDCTARAGALPAGSVGFRIFHTSGQLYLVSAVKRKRGGNVVVDTSASDDGNIVMTSSWLLLVSRAKCRK